ncbi:MAG: hypothetical protein EPN93_18200 [Spirochaetes bacterium]|nr:MAG: hypothetical protein EPN93_18200 [Spirochaetota bacterium]
MMTRASVNICQPGYGASCALCCGSHNPASTFLADDRAREDFAALGTTGPVQPEKMHCGHIGYLDRDARVIGCLVYATERPPESAALFESTCRHFSCRARDVLSAEEIAFAAQLMGDWVYYPLLITAIDLLRDMNRQYRTPENVPPSVTDSVKAGLRERAREAG